MCVCACVCVWSVVEDDFRRYVLRRAAERPRLATEPDALRETKVNLATNTSSHYRTGSSRAHVNAGFDGFCWFSLQHTRVV